MAERIHLTRWLYLFEKNLYQLEDQTEMSTVTTQTYDAHPLFALQAWIPQSEVKHLLKYGEEKKIAVIVEQPTFGEIPPTLLKNAPLVQEGEDLLSFYMTPSYWLWDPSTAIFFSFAIFFAMIFSDAGYALLLGLVIAYFWKKLGKTHSGIRFRALLVVMALCSLIWGILVGSYFGIAPKPSSSLGKLHILNMQNYSLMMGVAVGVGVIHLIFANLALAWSLRKSNLALAHVGWAIALLGAAFSFIGYQWVSGDLKILGFWGIGIGLSLVFLFNSAEKNLWKRVLKGFMGLTRISGIFGDVLSYLRLFALGLASASLAEVFNNLAGQVYSASPAFKIVFFLLIILIGHGINFLLAIMSGFIHGLRLNFIEFFNWSVPDEGTPFKAFSKRERSTWNQ
jgi:V/A-type H+-transporting ATPase subunit I